MPEDPATGNTRTAAASCGGPTGRRQRRARTTTFRELHKQSVEWSRGMPCNAWAYQEASTIAPGASMPLEFTLAMFPVLWFLLLLYGPWG